MIIRKDEEIEIWSDEVRKGEAKKCFIGAIISLIILTFCVFTMNLDFSIIETYYFVAIFIGFPCSLMILAGILFLFKEKQNPTLLSKMNKEYIEIYGKKDIKIEMNKIKKINNLTSNLGNFIVIFFEENDSTKKFSFEVSAANRGLFEKGIKEYNKNIVIENKNIDYKWRKDGR